MNHRRLRKAWRNKRNLTDNREVILYRFKNTNTIILEIILNLVKK